MAKLGSTVRIVARQMGGAGVRRALALVLAVALALTSAAPAWAVKVEVESEGEGSSPPGALPGLEAGPELGGEETALGEAPPLAGEEGEEEMIVPEAGPTEAGPTEAGPTEAGPTEAGPPPAEDAQPASGAAGAPAPAPAEPAVPAPAVTPAYEPAPPPTYQAEPPPPGVVHGETIVAPPSGAGSRGHGGRNAGPGASPQAAEVPASTVPQAEAPSPAPPPAEAPEPTSVPVAEPAEPGALAGRHIHVVRPGESLWSIATALLPRGADDAVIVAEVHRLWRLNSARIGTGDPSLIYAGTRLRLV
jgi:hypothetical protein